MKLSLEIDIEIKESLHNKDVLATVYYPNECNKIVITKGLNTIELSESIFHEIGHLIDWYLSDGKQSSDECIREDIANLIGESLRYREDSQVLVSEDHFKSK